MKKFFLMFFICVSSFMIYTNKVNAMVNVAQRHFTDNYIICSTGYGYCQDSLNIFTNISSSTTLGDVTGNVYFSFVSDPQIILTQVVLTNSTGGLFTCDIGSHTIYSDNTTGYNLYSAICPVNLNKYGIINIRFYYDDQYYNGNSFKFTMGDYYSFYRDVYGSDYTSLLNTINSNITSLNSSLGGKLDNQTTIITNIYNQITNTNTKLEDIKSKLDSIKNNASATASNTEQIKNDIKSENVSGAEGSADDLKNNSAFQDNTGLSGVISMPLTFVNSLTNTCQPITLNIPYMDVDVTIPCMQPIITNKMPLLANLIKIVVNGFIVYRIMLDIFQIVRNAKNPEDDRIEVLDL